MLLLEDPTVLRASYSGFVSKVNEHIYELDALKETWVAARAYMHLSVAKFVTTVTRHTA